MLYFVFAAPGKYPERVFLINFDLWTGRRRVPAESSAANHP
jgi:hypothetical protein